MPHKSKSTSKNGSSRKNSDSQGEYRVQNVLKNTISSSESESESDAESSSPTTVEKRNSSLIPDAACHQNLSSSGENSGSSSDEEEVTIYISQEIAHSEEISEKPEKQKTRRRRNTAEALALLSKSVEKTQKKKESAKEKERRSAVVHKYKQRTVTLPQKHKEKYEEKESDDDQEQEQETSKQSRTKKPVSSKKGCLWNLFVQSASLFFVCAIIFTAVLFADPRFFAQLMEFGGGAEVQKPFEVQPLVTHNPAPECIKISREQAHELKNSPSWDNVRRSLLFHMKRTGSVAINAFHVGEPRCFTLLRLADNRTIGMFNLEVSGVDLSSYTHLKERSTACPGDSFTVSRSKQIWVEYMDELTLDNFLHRFNATQAYALQSAYNYNRGYSICRTNEKQDIGMQLTTNLIREHFTLTKRQETLERQKQTQKV